MFYFFREIDEIIDNIWLGDYSSSQDITSLKNKGIKKVLTVMDYEGGPNYKENEFIHKRFNVDDNCRQNIIQYFGECLNFIKGDEKILVHCMAGASSSATIVIAYLMWNKRWKLDKAFETTREKRPIVGPNEGFMKQLEMFEDLLIKNDYDIDKINFKEIKWEPTEEMLKYDF